MIQSGILALTRTSNSADHQDLRRRQANTIPEQTQLNIGDEIEIGGPKGEMKYHKNLVKELSMIAGGTGITPKFQTIRRICEDPRDDTKTTLLYANKTKGDVL